MNPIPISNEPVAAGAPRWHRWRVPAFWALATFVVLLAPFWGPPLLRRLDFFHLRHVEIVGARYVEPADVLARMRVDTNFSVWDATDDLRTRILSHALVKDVVIERKLPGTLVVRIVEHSPVALVPGDSGLRAFDERGVALPIDPSSAEVDVPVVSSPDSATLRLLGAVRTQAPGLYRRLSEVRRDAPGELLFILDSMPVRALAGVTLERLTDLELVERDLSRRRLRIVELDLRYRDQVIARFQ